MENLGFIERLNCLIKRWGEAETENSYAKYDDGIKSFGIQLEPVTRVIDYIINIHKLK